MAEGYFNPKLKRLVNDSAQRRFRSTATAYFNKLNSLWLDINTTCNLFETFEHSISATYSSKTNSNMFFRGCNVKRIKECKNDSVMAECLLACAFNIFTAVQQSIQSVKDQRKAIATANAKFIQKKKEDDEDVAEAFIRTRNSCKVGKKRLRTKYKGVFNQKNLSFISELLMPAGRSKVQVQVVKREIATIFTILKTENVSLRKCKVRDLVKYSHDIGCQDEV
jgi:hypothetical protein